ncbi:MAG TPA: GAF domain-containing protein [Drouetiella sp.]
MTAQSDKSSALYLESNNILKLFNGVRTSIRQTEDEHAMLVSTAQAIGAGLGLDRCVIMRVDGERNSMEASDLRVAADYHTDGAQSLVDAHYKLKYSCEVYRLFCQGKPLPLNDVAPSVGATDRDLTQFGTDAESKALVAFPLVQGDRVLGLLSMHYCTEGRAFSDDLLEFGEAVADELALACERNIAASQLDVEAGFFKNTIFPAFVLDTAGQIKNFNDSFQQMISASRKDFANQSILDVIPDGQRLLDAVRSLSKTKPSMTVTSVIVGNNDGTSLVDVCISSVSKNGMSNDALLMFVPPAPKQDATSAGNDGKKKQTQDDVTTNLSRQLSWERWVRQIICKLHATLDRDTILQTVVDGFGRALGASRCLIVRTDGPASPLVTHEYAEPDISPLGLGRTGQFPTVAVSYFRHKVAAISDIEALERTQELSAEEYEYFADNGIRSMAGAPISSHGINYGVIIILETAPARLWTAHELDMLEIAASQTAVALSHSQQYLQLKDQLFNMNLLGNITQQLTNTLELVSRSKIEASEEKRPTENAPPLSLRELEVLKLIASGLANREIAQRLFLTESTVELHASRIRKKLKLKSRTALVKFACDNGLA